MVDVVVVVLMTAAAAVVTMMMAREHGKQKQLKFIEHDYL